MAGDSFSSQIFREWCDAILGKAHYCCGIAAEDPAAQNDLSSDHLAKVQELRERLERHKAAGRQ